jgi:quinol monooxygenase YgiN
MSITVVVRRQARPGHADALVTLATQRTVVPRGWQASRLQSRLFQGRDDPHLLLRVADWESSAAYWAAMAAVGGGDTLDALSTGPAERFFCEQLTLYENLTRPPTVVSCALIQARDGSTEQVLAYLREQSGPLVRSQPGLVLRAMYQDHGDVARFCVLHGWESPAALDGYYHGSRARVLAALDELGARLELFIGVTRALVDRYSGR